MSYIRPVYVPSKRTGAVYGPYYELVYSVRLGPDPLVRQKYVMYIGKLPGTPIGTKLLRPGVREMTHRTDIGKVQVFADDDVKDEDIEQLREAINDLTPAQKKDINKIELYSGHGPRVQGGYIAGLYSDNEKTIKLYNANGLNAASRADIEGTLMHEAGHNSYDRLTASSMSELSKNRSNKYDEQKSASKKLDTANIELNAALKEVLEFNSSKDKSGYTEADVERIASNYRQKRSQKADAQKDYNVTMSRADLDSKSMPHAYAYSEYQKAVDDEGSITRYSQTYKDTDPGLSRDENYAEASSLFTGYRRREEIAYAGETPVGNMTAREAHLYYPRTYKAWNETRRSEE